MDAREKATKEILEQYARCTDQGAKLAAGIIKDMIILISRKGGGVEDIIYQIDKLVDKIDKQNNRVEYGKNEFVVYPSMQPCKCEDGEKGTCFSRLCTNLPF